MSKFVNNFEAALAYAKRGWSVFPCHFITPSGCSCGQECRSPGKHPMTPDGHKSATTDEATIREWWEKCPNANIGLRTGPESGVWVLDLDGEDGLAAWDELLAKNGGCPKTMSARTGGGGMHLFFLLPTDHEIKSPAKIGGKPIDVRGKGGYVIATPSNHKSGKAYAWLDGPHETPLVEAPAWLVDFVTNRRAAHADDETHERMVGGLDLRNDPGVSVGQRHDRALALIGAHLGRGEDSIAVLQMALAWAERCSPPCDRDEIIRIVSDLGRREQEKLNDEPANEEVPWPVMDEAAYHGLVGEIVKAIEPETEADPAAILIQLLVFFGNLVGRNPFVQVEATQHFANLFAVVVGETAKARKGTSEGRVQELFKHIDPAWTKDRKQSGLSSGEGLISAVRDAAEKEEPIKKNGVVTGYQMVRTDKGVDDKRLLVVEAEFASVLRIAKREGNTLSPVLRHAWESGNLRTLTKQSPLRATGAHVSIVGHITKEELIGTMPEVEGFNGFANRFIWLCVTRSKLLPEGGKPVDLKSLIERLAAACTVARKTESMRRDEPATQLWAEMYRSLAKTKPGLLGAVISRAEAQLLRLSMIYALLDQSDTIRPEHLRAAMALWKYAEDSAKFIFGNSTGNTLADKILAILREGPATKREIHDKTNRHYAAHELSRALGVLERLKLAKRERIATAGRPAEKWYAAE